ncbi:zinc finger protein 91-like isoform X2, partial [Clarias magur]
MERLAVAVREILEAVEATITEYRTETAQTRVENETLKQQLRELLTPVQDPVLMSSNSGSDEISPCVQQEWSSGLEEPTEPLEGNENQVPSEGVSKDPDTGHSRHWLILEPNMTKLQLLHRALNERLMAAVEQIMEMVGGTVLEYEEETVRARKENEVLRRRLRWMEGENPTDWPDPTAVPGEASLTETLTLESLIIKTEPVDASDFPLYGPDTSLTASVCTTDMEMVYPGTSAPVDASVSDGIVWDSAQSYMAPLDFDPTLSTMARNRSQRRSFACPDCGKVFGREQRLMFHMRVHSAERPYTYRRRKTCFYGDKKRKKKLRGLSKTSREFIEDLSDSSEQTEQSTGWVGISSRAGPSGPEVEPSEASDETSEHTSSSSKLSETSAAKPVGLKAKQGREKSKTAQCLQCNKAFTNVSRLAVHMKTHRKPILNQDEQNVQDDADRADGGSHLTKVIRNNETEVEKAKAIGQRLFQCPECKKIFARSCWLTFHLKSHERERKRQKKKQLQTTNLKDAPQVSEEPKKEVATESSKVHVLKKIFACPYCDKVFAREGWLAPHIRSHTLNQQKSDIHSDAILPNSTKRRTRRVITKPSSSEGGNEQNKISEQSLEETETSEIVSDQPKNDPAASQSITMELKTNPETKIIITNDSINNETETISNETETVTNKIPEEPKPVPEESPVKKGVKKSKKRFPCRECGKVYLLAGWLKTHKKMHKKERIVEENRRQLLLMKEFGQNDNKEGEQSLVETNVVEKKQKKQKKNLGLQDGLDEKKKKKSQLTNEVLLKTMDNSSDVQTAAEKSKDSDGATRGRCVCKDCGKVYARKNWLSLHMLGHRKALLALPQKANDDALKSDGQTTQEGSSTEDSKGQKGKEGGKASFPCPFCDKVFPRAMRLMVHMQIHSGEKPYSYRQRKEQFYSDPTRPRVPDTDKQEPAVEGNDAKGKDGENEVTRSQTSAVSQDHASTTEPMETVPPQSVCTGRKFSLLPLQSSAAATIHSTTVTRTDSKSDSNFSLQPRIVLDPVITESSHSASSEKGDCKAVIVENSDIQMLGLEMNYAATGGEVKSHLPQTLLENSQPCASQNVLAETDHPPVLGVKIGPVHKYHGTPCSEKLLVSMQDQQCSDSPKHRKSEICQRESHVESREYSLFDVKQHKVQHDPEHLETAVESQQSGGQVHTQGNSRFPGVVKAKNIPPHSTDLALKTVPEFVPTESSTSTICQVSHTESGYMVLSDVSDDDEWANVSSNPDGKKEKQTLKIFTPLHEWMGDTGSVPSSSYKPSDSDSNVMFMLEKAGEQNVIDGTLVNRGDMAATSVQQTDEPSSSGQKKWFTCLSCDLTFASEASLTQHMKVHAVSAGTYQKSNAFKTVKKRVKNNETKLKQPVVQVQTSEVGSADSTDTSETSGKSDSALINVSTAKLSGCCPDTHSATSRRSRADSKTVDRKSKKGTRTPHCCYCGKACEKIELHLMHDHPKEPKVMEAFHFSNTLEERKRLLRLLCSNKKLQDVYTSRNKKDDDHVHCIFCQGYYQRKQFWKHALICKQKQLKVSILPEPGSSTDLPNISPRSRQSLVQKTSDPESGKLVKDTFHGSVQPAIPESVNLPPPKAQYHTTHNYLYSLSAVSGTFSAEVNSILDQGSIIGTGNSSAMMNLASESSGPLDSAIEYTDAPGREFGPNTVQDALVENENFTCTPLRTKATLEKDLEIFNLKPENELSNVRQPSSSVLSSPDIGSHNPQRKTNQDCQSSSPLHCSEKHVAPQDSLSSIHTGSSDSQPSTNLKSDWTNIATVDFEQSLRFNSEPEQTASMMPELVSEGTAKSNPHSESTKFLTANILTSDAQESANPDTGNDFSHDFGNGEHRAPDIGSICDLIPDEFVSEKQQTTNPERSSAAEKQFDFEGHVRDDTEEGGKYTTGQDSQMKPLDLDYKAASKRRKESRSRDTKRRRQSDSLQQTSPEERKSSPVSSQAPEMKCGLQISDVWKSLKTRKGKSKLQPKKTHYCLYCRKPSLQMKRHLLSIHAKEPEVAKALRYDKKSKERKQLLDLLQTKGNLLHKDVHVDMSIPLSEELLLANQASSPHSNRGTSKLENPNDESVSTDVSDTEEIGLVGEKMLADLESQTDLTPDTSLVRTDHERKSTTCSFSANDESQTIKSEDKAPDAYQSSWKEHMLGNTCRRRSSRIRAQPIKIKDNPSDEAQSLSQSSNQHICRHCSATFCSSYHLRRHEYTHTDERPYWCSECNVGFIQKYRYRNHRMTRHGETQSSEFKDPSTRHTKLSHSEGNLVENKLHLQQLDHSTTATSELSSNADETPVLTER